MKERKIELTEQELEEIKDTIKFRTKVLTQLKQLNNIPKDVWTLKTKMNVQWIILIAIIAGIIGVFFRK